MVNNIPPKQTLSSLAGTTPADHPEYDPLPHPNPLPGSLPPHASMIIHDPSQHGDPNSFPVLKAFQDYLEMERQQARKRLVTLTVFFVSLMTLVVAGFILAFIFLLGNQAKREDQQQARQDRLLEEVLQPRKPPEPTAPPPPSTEHVAQQLAKEFQTTALNLQTNLNNQLSAVGEVATRLDSKVDAQNAEVAKLRDALVALQKENASIRTDLPKLAAEAARKTPPTVTPALPVPPAPAAPRATTPVPVPPAPASPRATASVTAPTPPPAAPPATPPAARAAPRGTNLKGYDETVLLLNARDSNNKISWHAFVPR